MVAQHCKYTANHWIVYFKMAKMFYYINYLESNSKRETQISYDIAYLWNLKKMVQMNLFTK